MPCKILIDTVSDIEDYHRYLEKFLPDEKLVIVLDSIKEVSDDHSLFAVYSTFTNKTDTAVYVIRDTSCLRMVNTIVMNDEDLSMKKNAIFIDCLGEKIMPDILTGLKVILPADIKFFFNTGIPG